MQKENLLAILRFILYDVIVYNLRKVLILMKHKKKLTEFYPLVTDKLDKAEPLKGEELKDVRNMIQQAFKMKK